MPRERTSHELSGIHRLCTGHRDAIERSNSCGCFYCVRIFPANQINEWIDGIDLPRPVTALCPHCGIDAILPDASIDITAELLAEMRRVWFGK